MSKLKIYGTARSRAFRTMWCANELGVPFEGDPAFQTFESLKSDAFKKINPNGKIPAIDDGGTVIWESMAANLYLVQKHGGLLGPHNAAEYGHILQWSFFGMTEIEPAALIILANKMMLPPEKRDQARLDKAVASLAKPLDVLDGALAANGHLVGGRFTVADLNVASVLVWAKLAGRAIYEGRPHFSAWSKAVDARPAYKASVALMA